MKLEDGKGSGKVAEVSDKNRLLTQSAASTEMHENTQNEEQVYMFSTNGFIAINTLNTETGIMYVKNTSATKNLFIHDIRTCGNQVQKVVIYKNPTGGTLISNATAGASCNLNFKSSNTPEANIYKGADGSTISSGTHLGQHINGVGHSNISTGDSILLGRNDSIGISFELAASGVVCAAISGYYE